jgi:hypothetical protein
VIKRYDAFFRAYMKLLRKQESMGRGGQFREVHIGTGYTEVNLSGLESAQPIPIQDTEVYTDARSQRLLFRLSDSEIDTMQSQT